MELADEHSTDFYILRETYKLFLPQNGSCRDGYIAYINIICPVTGRGDLIGRYLLRMENKKTVVVFRLVKRKVAHARVYNSTIK